MNKGIGYIRIVLMIDYNLINHQSLLPLVTEDERFFIVDISVNFILRNLIFLLF